MTSFTTPTSTERLKAARAAGLEPDLLIKAFRLMQTSRSLDDREIRLKRQQRIYFQISGAGHEAIQVAAGMPLPVGPVPGKSLFAGILSIEYQYMPG